MVALAVATLVWGSQCQDARADPFEVPALSSPATDAHLIGKLVWLDLETTDLPVAKRFYRALFGWDYRDYHAGDADYTVALEHGTPVAGLVRRPVVNDTERRSAWLPFFSVADVSVTFTQALHAHAEVRSEPAMLPLRGRQARLTDPEGAAFAILTSSSGDPSDDPNPRALGTWGSPSLWARDPADEAVFYQGLFNYSVVGQPTAAGFERIELSSGPIERATVRPLSGALDALRRPQWISFVRVARIADTVSLTVKLGGHLRLAPARAAHGATSAILEDPTGAAFGVIELPPDMVKRAP